MKECIELEHSDEYQRGYADGIESFRETFKELTNKSCLGCKWLSSTGKTTKEYCHKCSIFWDSNFELRDAE